MTFLDVLDARNELRRLSDDVTVSCITFSLMHPDLDLEGLFTENVWKVEES